MTKRITQLPALGAADGNEVVAAVQDGTTKKGTVPALLSAAGGAALIGNLDLGHNRILNERTPNFWLFRQNAQTIPNSTWTKIIWEGDLIEIFLGHGYGFWSAANPTRLSLPENGIYGSTANIAWEGNATGVRRLRLVQDGNSPETQYTYAATDIAGLNLADGQTQMMAGEPGTNSVPSYVEYYVWQNSGGDLDLLPTGFLSCPIANGYYLGEA